MDGAENFTTTTTKGIKLHEKDVPGPTVGGAGRGWGEKTGVEAMAWAVQKQVYRSRGVSYLLFLRDKTVLGNNRNKRGTIEETTWLTTI